MKLKLYKAIALLRGFREAYDYDMDLLVVWHPVRSVHFSGLKAWKHAALWRGQ